MTFFKPGDRVTVRHDLIRYRQYYMSDSITCDSVVDDMMTMRGKIVTISGNTFGKYRINESGYNWTDDMFEEFANRNAEPLDIGQAAGESDIMKMLYGGEHERAV